MLCRVNELIGDALPVLISLGVIYFIWGILQYVIGDSDEAKKKGRDRMIFGIIGLAVIVSIWGLVNIVVVTFGVGGASAPTEQINSLIATPASNSDCPDLSGSPKLADLLNYVTCFIGKSVIPLIFALAVLMFIWGVVQFLIIGGSDETKRTQGKQLMIWGIIALTVMMGVWSLVSILGSTFGVKDTSFLPQVRP